MKLRLPALPAPRFQPTARAVLLLLAIAPVGLIAAVLAPAAWTLAPALGGALLLLVLLDAAFAGTIGDARVLVDDEAEVGRTLRLVVLAEPLRAPARRAEAALAVGAQLVEGGRIGVPLAIADGALQGAVDVAPVRRGAARIETLWLRWAGPLGLAERTVSRPLDLTVRVQPDLSALRSGELQLFLRDADIGLVARRVRGAGAEFEALADYEPGMDRRRIDWKASARHARLVAREYETERNTQIVFALDCGQAMCEPVAGLARIDRAVTAVLATAWVALKGQDRVALLGFAAKPLALTPFVTAPRDFHRLREAAADLDYRTEEPNFTWAMATLASRLKRRSLVVVFSDFTDPASAELMLESVGRLVDRHVVLFVVMEDAELTGIATAPPVDLDAVSQAVTANALLHQRQLVLQRLRRLGVRVVEARHDAIGLALIDAYLAVKRQGLVG
ncbi:DUF58 domain-containing protein [Novosphingobium percolationis]|uniref:DUF58 domain-containing protein n=1 Tax=Novosphingobium percolationis TaxID=2871811 RepID=UPI001CD2C46F|nr:DUF58 domain-containing protein [Novosphingobium percolationis]